ncbi:MAG: MBOAT family protein [Oscillospiraceae bacterium]|nr:MBOAT family protein [Oscillospiraceae bacterium]
MVFNSPAYLFAFFPAVWLIARPLGDKGRKLFLCAALLLFYAFGDVRSLPFLLLFAALQYVLALRIRGRRALLVLGVVLDVGALCVCKAVGRAPLGVSFFTFQAVAYLTEVYRAPEKASRDAAEVLLYLCFFPRLLSGPLMGWDEHHRQYTSLRMDACSAAEGVCRFVRGLAKKLLLSDMVGRIADEVFAAEVGSLSSAGAWLGAVAYCLQLYYDFSGYSDMAIGMGKCFGFTFPENFDRPFISVSIGEFWRRWHMTLGGWFRQYVYFPLGGSRRGRGRTALNKLVVFLLTGLWHGFGWTFLLWGLWHGLLSAMESLWDGHRKYARFYTLPAVLLGFVMFRAESVGQGFALIARLFSFSGGALPALNGVRLCALLAALPLSVVKLPGEKLPAWLRTAAVLLLYVLCLCVMAGNDFAPFIYAQF